jgi:nicotinate-nucleotide adenylyltransferase
VRWIPSGRPGHRGPPQASDEERLAMLELALGDRPAFSIDAAELRSPVPTFTVKTLERTRAEAGPETPLVFLVGADQLMALDTWRDWRRLLGLAHFGVAARPGHPIDPGAMSPALLEEYRARQAGPAELGSRPAGHICVYPVSPLDISSSEVRKAIAAGHEPLDLVPPKVLDYIRSRRLYSKRT